MLVLKHSVGTWFAKKSGTEFIILPSAEGDIADILQYTLEQWGDDQVDRCWSILWDAFERIRQFPEIGRQPASAHSDEREYVLPNHTIVYQVVSGRTLILRIVNPRRVRG